jgi:hypothetical protein
VRRISVFIPPAVRWPCRDEGGREDSAAPFLGYPIPMPLSSPAEPKSVHTRLAPSGSATDPTIVGPPQSVCTNVLWFDLDSRQRTYRERTSRGRRHAQQTVDIRTSRASRRLPHRPDSRRSVCQHGPVFAQGDAGHHTGGTCAVSATRVGPALAGQKSHAKTSSQPVQLAERQGP